MAHKTTENVRSQQRAESDRYCRLCSSISFDTRVATAGDSGQPILSSAAPSPTATSPSNGSQSATRSLLETLIHEIPPSTQARAQASNAVTDGKRSKEMTADVTNGDSRDAASTASFTADSTAADGDVDEDDDEDDKASQNAVQGTDVAMLTACLPSVTAATLHFSAIAARVASSSGFATSVSISIL